MTPVIMNRLNERRVEYSSYYTRIRERMVGKPSNQVTAVTRNESITKSKPTGRYVKLGCYRHVPATNTRRRRNLPRRDSLSLILQFVYVAVKLRRTNRHCPAFSSRANRAQEPFRRITPRRPD